MSMNANLRPSAGSPPLGIIAGSGDLPARLLAACQQTGRPVFVLAFEGSTAPELIENIPHAWSRLGAIGHAIACLKNAGVSDIVMAGKIERPPLASLRPDLTGTRLLARLGGSYLQGDDSLLTTIVQFLEEEGFRVHGADELLVELVTPEGLIGHHLPDKRAQADIETGVRVARAIGELDIGQAVIVQFGRVLGVEAAEGTDALIERCGPLRAEGMGGVLVKAKKPQQERRVDLPTIGVSTVERIHKAGFAGIAVEAGGSLIIDRAKVRATANALDIFVIGFSFN